VVDPSLADGATSAGEMLVQQQGLSLPVEHGMDTKGCARSLVASMPLAGAGWYAPLAIATPVLVAALAAWSLYVIVTSRPGASSRPVSAAPA